MITKKLRSEYNGLIDLNVLVTTYEEIAATRMRKTKNTVLQNRTFLSDLNNIYGYVRNIYKGDIVKINIKKKLNVLNKTKGGVSVLLSANTGLYGSIVRSTFDLFEKETKSTYDDIVIIGRIGKKLYDMFDKNKTYKYIDFTDGFISHDATKELLDYCLKYENINVYHGLFVSILTQEAVDTKVTGDFGAQSTKNTERSAQLSNYKVPAEDIFEPSLTSIVDFFERQILSAIFEQALYESNLSKFAARMLSLDMATSRIANNLKTTNFKMQKARHNFMEHQQLSVLTGMLVGKA